MLACRQSLVFESLQAGSARDTWAPQQAYNLAPPQTDIFSTFFPASTGLEKLGGRVPKLWILFREIVPRVETRI